MTKLLVLWVLLAAAIGLTAGLLPGMHVRGGVLALMVISFVYSFVNVLIGATLRLLLLPLNAITLGLVGLIVNVAMLALTDWAIDRLSIDNLLTAVVATVVITFFSALLQFVLLRGRLSAATT